MRCCAPLRRAFRGQTASPTFGFPEHTKGLILSWNRVSFSSSDENDAVLNRRLVENLGQTITCVHWNLRDVPPKTTTSSLETHDVSGSQNDTANQTDSTQSEILTFSDRERLEVLLEKEDSEAEDGPLLVWVDDLRIEEYVSPVLWGLRRDARIVRFLSDMQLSNQGKEDVRYREAMVARELASILRSDLTLVESPEERQFFIDNHNVPSQKLHSAITWDLVKRRLAELMHTPRDVATNMVRYQAHRAMVFRNKLQALSKQANT